MNSKKKLIVSMLVVAFVLLSIIATVAIAFALTQQTIKTTLNIGYTVEDIDGTASATFTIGGVTENLTAMKGTQVIGDKLVFKAGDTENAGNLMFPEDALALTAQDSEVVIQYTYSNTGSKHYIASMNLNANIEKDNMKVEYSIDGTTYSEDRYAVVVPANTSNRSYWIKISIIDKAKNASFTGDFDWMLKGCDPQSADYLTIISSEMQETGTAGTYSIKLNGEGYLPGGEVVFPSSVNGDPVTTIVASSLTDAEKQQVTSAYIPDTVTTIGENAFADFANLETVTLEQNEGVATASAQSNSGLTTIGANAFKNCSKLNNLEIPSTVTSFDSTSLIGCTSLKDITINTKDLSWKNIGGGVSELLWKYDNGINLTLGYGTETIGEFVFEGAHGLASITIPDSVTSIGSYAFDRCSTLKTVIFEGNSNVSSLVGVFHDCSSLTNITIPNSVTNISDAFYNCSSLTSIEIPAGVTNMAGAFGGCCSLTSIEIPAGVTNISGAFSDCSSLTTITIPSGVTNINGAFYNCSSLTSIEIPVGVTSIGWGTFSGCSSLTSIEIPDSITSIESFAFSGCSSLTSIEIPASVTTLGVECIFSGCSGLESLVVDENNEIYHSAGNCLIETESKTLIQGCKTSVIPADGSVTSIDWGAFKDISTLVSITIPAAVTEVRSEVFDGCTGLKNVVIENGVQGIGYAAFKNCSSLTSITIPASVTGLGDCVLEGCSKLIDINVDRDNAVYHSDGNCIIETESKTLLYGCKTSVIPTDGSVTSIGYYAFSGCIGLMEIIVPDCVTSIGESAFSNCAGLTSVTFGFGLTSIGYNAFQGCTELTSVTFAENSQLTTIGNSAFSGCCSLTSIIIPESVTSINYQAFNKCTGLITVTFENTNGWFFANSMYATSGTNLSSSDMANSSTAATFLTSTYVNKFLKRS